jgi:hypothetical protein
MIGPRADLSDVPWRPAMPLLDMAIFSANSEKPQGQNQFDFPGTFCYPVVILSRVNYPV